MENSAAAQVLRYFKSRNLAGLRSIRHHLDKEELRHGAVDLLDQLAGNLDTMGFDGKHKAMPREYRELLIEIATIVGAYPVLTCSQRGAVISSDVELVRCLLNQLQTWQDEAIVAAIPGTLVNSQFATAMLLIDFYLHRLPVGRRSEKRLTALELYQCFDACCESVPFKSLGDDELAKAKLMQLMMDTGYIHHILYMSQTCRFVPRHEFFEALQSINPSQQQLLRQFHAQKNLKNT